MSGWFMRKLANASNRSSAYCQDLIFVSARYDAIVGGAGHNGMTKAASLARQELSVLALEKRPIVGGCATTDELWPSFKVSRLSYAYSQAEPNRRADVA